MVVFSGSSLNVDTNPGSIALDGGIKTIQVLVENERGQAARAGTTVSVEATQGNLVGPSSFSQPNTSEVGTPFVFRLEPEDEAGTGVFLVTVTTASGVMSSGTADTRQASAR